MQITVFESNNYEITIKSEYEAVMVSIAKMQFYTQCRLFDHSPQAILESCLQ